MDKGGDQSKLSTNLVDDRAVDIDQPKASQLITNPTLPYSRTIFETDQFPIILFPQLFDEASVGMPNILPASDDADVGIKAGKIDLIEPAFLGILLLIKAKRVKELPIDPPPIIASDFPASIHVDDRPPISPSLEINRAGRVINNLPSASEWKFYQDTLLTSLYHIITHFLNLSTLLPQ